MAIRRFKNEPNAAGIKVNEISPRVKEYMEGIARTCAIVTPRFYNSATAECVFYIERLDDVVDLYTSLDAYFEGSLDRAGVFIFYHNTETVENNQRVLEVFVGACDNTVFEVMRLLRAVVESSDQLYVRVVVSPELSSYAIADITQFLCKNLFEEPNLTATTASGEILPKPVITYILDKNNLSIDTNIPRMVTKALQLKEKIIPDKLDTCTYTVHVPASTLLNARQEFMEKDVEFGGALVITGYTVTQNTGKSKVEAKLRIPEKSVTPGKQLSVFPPETLINFHTHPIVTYNLNGLVLNAPSGNDLVAASHFRSFGNVLHILISIEGIYTVQLTPEYQRYMDYIHMFAPADVYKCKALLLKTLLQPLANSLEEYSHGFKLANGMFQYYHGGGEKDMNKFLYGGINNVTERDMYNINMYLKNVNKLTIKDVVKSNLDKTQCAWLDQPENFVLFSVTFTPWINISRNGLSVDVTTVARDKLRCPPEITHELHRLDNTVMI